MATPPSPPPNATLPPKPGSVLTASSPSPSPNALEQSINNQKREAVSLSSGAQAPRPGSVLTAPSLSSSPNAFEQSINNQKRETLSSGAQPPRPMSVLTTPSTPPPPNTSQPSSTKRDSPNGEATQTGSVTKGSECKAKAVALLEKFRLPVGLFPITNIEELGVNEANGLIWMKQPARSERDFPDGEIVIHYARVIQGNIEANRLKNMVGFKVKDMKEKNLFISVPYSEIKVDGDQIMFLSEKGGPRAYPASVFRATARSSSNAML